MILRTEVTLPEQSKHTGKWAISFANYLKRSEGDSEFLSSTCTSAFVFDTEDEAYEGGNRAMAVLEATGQFPNMCEKF